MSHVPEVHNIGPSQRRQRRLMGGVTLAVAVALAAGAAIADWASLPRLLLAPLFFAGFVGVLQSRAHTCVVLAATGQCDLAGSVERVADAGELRAMRAKALGVLGRSAVATLVVMVAVLAIP